ncbi:hypothetical protein BV911_02380 [Pseudoruegeria sp. SK021]|nr:hypothetical protein BV911_02380 [Pseudoruegeria sp. SK021]
MSPTADLTACAFCDALYTVSEVPSGGVGRCNRCRAILYAPRDNAIAKIVAYSAAALSLMVVAIGYPFLEIHTSGLSSKASVIDAILAFAENSGMMAPLSAVVAALIVLLPVIRISGMIYTTVPMLFDRPLLPYAKNVFMIVMRLRPWAMAEIFIIGVAVALVKIGSLATVSFGPAFWAFVGFVVLIVAKDVVLCERTMWRTLDTYQKR